MTGNNNHDEDPEALATAERDLNTTLERSDIDNVFTIPQGADNIKWLGSPGDDLVALLMRGDLPVDDAFAWAISTRIKKCRRHHDIEGERQITIFVAAKVGQAARRANLIGQIMGVENRLANMRRGVGDWIRDKAGIGGDTVER